MEIEKSMIAPMMSIPGAAAAQADDDDEREQSNAELSAEKLQLLQERKEFYHSLFKDQAVSMLKYVFIFIVFQI